MARTYARYALVSLVLIFLLVSCVEGRNAEPNEEVSVSAPPSVENGVAGGSAGESGPFVSVLYNAVGTAGDLVIPGTPDAPSHKKYLADPSTMVPAPSELPGGGSPVVIGSDVARFWPFVQLQKQGDLERLQNGTALSIGTLLAVGDKIQATDDEYDGLFKFEDEYNWFYEAIYDGKKGLVFGADLIGLRDQDPKDERLAVIALRYRTKGKYDLFYSLKGLNPLPRQVADVLSKDRVMLSKADWTESKYDDMFGLYGNETWDRQNPVFITTDLAAHAAHVVFDKYLQRVEEDYFTPRLKDLVGAYLEKIEALIASDDKSVPEYTETLAIARQYFQVPEAILEAAPERRAGGGESSGIGDYSEKTIEYVAPDMNAVFAEYPETVRTTLELMEKHAGWGMDPLFKYNEDFSQYKSRGHYTRNGILTAYFQAMMWFGRIHSYVAVRDEQRWVWSTADPSAPGTSTGLSLRLTPFAILVNRLTNDDPALMKAWRALFDPITYLIGISDDLSFDDVIPFLKQNPIENFQAWAGDMDALNRFIAKAGKELRSPLIAGNSVIYVPSGKENTPPMGWRLFGQRFTWDSAVHMAVSSPRLTNDEPVRYWVSGIDLMRAFGSRAADSILADWENGYPQFPMLKKVLDGMEKEFSSHKADFWASTYYNRALFLIKSQAQFEQGSGFYFTETPVWNYKALLSAQGTWAELRHDTILYVKQAYGGEAEMGGGGWEPTWRVKPVPVPIHYIEPNLSFWTGIRLLVRDLAMNASDTGMLPEAYADAFETLESVFAEATDIVRLEIGDKPISESQNESIRSIPARLAAAADPERGRGYSPEEDDERMGIIADVYTSVEKKGVLEIAVGVPYRIQLLLNDGQGGKRVATGYMFSYYEFPHSMDDRMTDEQWREIAYKGGDLSEYQPFWLKDVVK